MSDFDYIIKLEGPFENGFINITFKGSGNPGDDNPYDETRQFDKAEILDLIARLQKMTGTWVNLERRDEIIRDEARAEIVAKLRERAGNISDPQHFTWTILIADLIEEWGCK